MFRPGFTGRGEDKTKTFTYIADYSISPAATSGTIAGVAIGKPHRKRLVVIGLSCQPVAATPLLVTACKIGGVVASLVTEVSGDGTTSIWRAVVPSGATADVELTFSVAAKIARAGVWRAQNLASNTPVGATSNRSQTGTKTATINAPAGGWIVGVGGSKSNSSTFVWAAPLTERYDPSGGAASGADGVSVSAGSVNVQYTCSGGDINAISAASWG